MEESALIEIYSFVYFRIAMMTMDYHDYCQSKTATDVSQREKSGIAEFTFRLLERSGYRILEVPYSEFGVNEKLLRRVQFLEGRLKQINLGAAAATATVVEEGTKKGSSGV